MPIVEFARYLSNEDQVSVILDQDLDSHLVTLEVVDLPVSQILAAVARRAGKQLTKAGSMYHIGNLRPEDQGVLVRRVRGLSAQGVSAAVQVLLTQDGTVQSFPDGLVVVADRVEILQKVVEVFDQVEGTPRSSWCVQVILVSYDRSQQEKFGLDVTPTLDVAAAFASSAVVGSVAGIPAAAARGGEVSAAAGLSAVLEASRVGRGVSIVAGPTFLMDDGQTAKLERGVRVPVPRRVVSGQSGSVETTGYEYEQTGLVVTADLREKSSDSVTLNLSLTLSEITGYNAEAPITSRENFNTSATVKDGGVYLAGSLERSTERGEVSDWFRLSRSQESADQLLQVWVLVRRVASPLQQRGADDREGERAPESERAGAQLEPLPLAFDRLESGGRSEDNVAFPSSRETQHGEIPQHKRDHVLPRRDDQEGYQEYHLGQSVR